MNTELKEVFSVFRVWVSSDQTEFKSGTYPTLEEAIEEAKNLMTIREWLNDNSYFPITISNKEYQTNEGVVVAHNVIWKDGEFVKQL